MSVEVVTTSRGARAILDLEVGQVMHPIVGPFIEAARLYTEPSRLRERLSAPAADPLLLLDVGLGAASNAIAAWRISEALPPQARRLEIVSFDHKRSALELALLHPHDFSLDGAAGEAARALLDHGVHETARTRWRFVEGELPDSLQAVSEASADLVFWDLYSPKANPTMWTHAAFAALRRVCGPGCAVFTYSGATATRAAMLLAGFAVGFGVLVDEDKKRATCAALDARDLREPLDARWLDRLSRSSAPMPSDAPADAFARIAAAPQFRTRSDGR